MYGAQEGEVKGHLGVKMSCYSWSCAPYLCSVCDHFVKMFAYLVFISGFQQQFCSHLIQMILGYCHMYRAQEGEVKGHLGSKGHAIVCHVHLIIVKVVLCVLFSKLFLLVVNF